MSFLFGVATGVGLVIGGRIVLRLGLVALKAYAKELLKEVKE